MSFNLNPTVAENKVRIDLPDGVWFDMFPDQATQLGGTLIRRAYEAAGLPVPDEIRIAFKD